MGKWEYKMQAFKYYDLIKEELGIEPEYRDLINYRIIATSKDQVKADFTFYKYGWNLINKDTSNADEIYNEFFNSEEDEVYPISSEDVLSEIDRIVEGAQDPNFKIYHQNYEQELYKNSVMDLGKEDDLEGNKKIKLNNSELKSTEPIKKESNLEEDILYAFGFIMILGWIRIGGVIRYIVNPEIPTWLILSILFIGFILVRRYYRYKE